MNIVQFKYQKDYKSILDINYIIHQGGKFYESSHY